MHSLIPLLIRKCHAVQQQRSLDKVPEPESAQVGGSEAAVIQVDKRCRGHSTAYISRQMITHIEYNKNNNE